MKRGRGRKP